MNYLMKILNIIADVLKSYFKLKSDISNNESESRKEKKKLKENVDKDISNANKAIESKDEDAINKIFKIWLFIILSFIIVGCQSTEVVYVSENEKIKAITYEGINGYFIPKSKMIEITDAYIKYKYYLDKYGPIN